MVVRTSSWPSSSCPWRCVPRRCERYTAWTSP